MGNNFGNVVINSENQVRGNIHTNINEEVQNMAEGARLYGIPLNTSRIVGREKDIEELKKLITSGDHKPVAITGLAAMGKTSLAIHCARLWSDPETGFVKYVALIDARNEKSLEESIRGLAACLKLKVKGIDTKSVVHQINNFFCQNGKVLMIYDNINDFRKVQDYLLSLEERNIYILATTQITEIQIVFNCYPLGYLSTDSSKELIESILGESQFNALTSSNCNNIVNICEGHAYGLVHACTNITTNCKYNDGEAKVNRTVKKFLDNYYDNNINSELPHDSMGNYNKILLKRLMQNIKKLPENSLAKHMLCIFSYMDPVSYITKIVTDKLEKTLLKSSIKGLKDNENPLRELKKYSLITEFKIKFKNKEEKIMYKVHRLVQAACRIRIKEKKLENEYIRILTSTFPGPEQERYEQRERGKVEDISENLNVLELNNLVLENWIRTDNISYDYRGLHVSNSTLEDVNFLLKKLKSTGNEHICKFHVARKEGYVQFYKQLPDMESEINIDTSKYEYTLDVAFDESVKNKTSCTLKCCFGK